ncbi:MAG: hypothetical protein M3460_28120 [Actinomycetota bacterium]|nr:hypothetical protein [Actinomycetota bacterium]
MGTKNERPRPKDADELLAQAAVAAALHAPVERTDDGSRPGMCDLEIQYPDGRRGAVEVVSTRDYQTEQFASATLGKGHIAHSALTRVWGVSVAPEATVKKMVARLPGFLARLEANGVEGAQRGQYGPWLREMEDLGIDLCWSSPAIDTVVPGFRLFPFPTGAWSKGIDTAVQRCEKFLAADAQSDVVNKLRAAGADERHAVVVVTRHWLDVEDEIRCGRALPVASPVFPKEIDVLWMVVLWGGPTRAVYWTGDRGWADIIFDDWRPEAWR